VHASPIFRKLWKRKCLNKQFFFVWLILVDRINTRDMMNRHNWHVASGLNCAVCTAQERETKEHLFFNCRFAQRVWSSLGITWIANPCISTMLELAKASFGGPKFLEVITCALWGIWKSRNGVIFEGKQSSYRAWKLYLSMIWVWFCIGLSPFIRQHSPVG
jgi:hypothetical protein